MAGSGTRRGGDGGAPALPGPRLQIAGATNGPGITTFRNRLAEGAPSRELRGVLVRSFTGAAIMAHGDFSEACTQATLDALTRCRFTFARQFGALLRSSILKR